MVSILSDKNSEKEVFRNYFIEDAPEAVFDKTIEEKMIDFQLKYVKVEEPLELSAIDEECNLIDQSETFKTKKTIRSSVINPSSGMNIRQSFIKEYRKTSVSEVVEKPKVVNKRKSCTFTHSFFSPGDSGSRSTNKISSSRISNLNLASTLRRTRNLEVEITKDDKHRNSILGKLRSSLSK